MISIPTRLLRFFIVSASLLALAACGRWEPPQEIAEVYIDLPEQIDFNYHVKPILSDKCFACHGPDATNQLSSFRIDLEEYAFAALEGSPGKKAIVPGKPGKSDALLRMLSSDASYQMPPPESHLTLEPREIAIIVKWIEQGAQYKPHWSFIPPEAVTPPATRFSDWVVNDIDRFVGKKLEDQGIQPSEEASKETLIRRLTFDLTGLPPSLEEIESFVRNDSPDAYERLVDRLIASPAYGERMAADWMDVARFADSDGYLDDKHRDFSPYRDWVIQAFNDNMSYEQFITWQLAGDLLDHPSKESILATAFNRLHKRNSEAGIVFEEYRVEYVADRAQTVGKAIMGLTMECARCHDHKYDPITQREYFELFAFFNSTNEIGTAVYGPGQVPGPSLLLTDTEQEKLLTYLDSKIRSESDQLHRLLEEETPSLHGWAEQPDRVMASIEKGLRDALVAYYPLDRFDPQETAGQYTSPNAVANGNPIRIKEPDLGKGIKGEGVFLNDYTTLTLPEKVGWFDHTDPFSLSVAVFPEKEFEEAGILYHCEDIRLGLKGYSLFLEDNRLKFIISYSWPTNAIQVETLDPLPVQEWTQVTLTYDGKGKASGVGVYLNGEAVPVVVKADNLYKSILFKPDIHTYGFRGLTLGERDKMKTFLKSGLDELSVFSDELTPLEVRQLFDREAVREVLATPTHPAHFDLIKNQYQRREIREVSRARERLRAAKKEKMALVEDIPEIMVMGDTDEPRPTFILDRGLYSDPTEEVFPSLPKRILPFDEDLPRNRLGLAKWVFDERNPLTARVYVNRLWQMHFGKGLVETSDDFGNQGSLPTHPELLDWLAVTFRESGWDSKYMHKLMVMSATYRQTSHASKELLELDPANNLLARGPSYRMTAEMVRDNALAISGLLSPRIGGPSVYPYQPEGLWDELSSKIWRYKYLQEPGEGLYRRSLYTIWKRTSGPPSMMIFDVGDRNECSVKRRQTSTPLQALVLLNDPQYLEAARVMAENLLESFPERESRLKNAFLLSIGRTPREREFELVANYYDEELEKFKLNRQDAIAYVGIGATPMGTGKDPVQVAALATVINGLMNTSDGYTIR
ncbi:putative protein-signal peptide and transmembrane prediction [Lunatimonas lonarensis]|uniref:Cytochrome c domain-containing protein n=1 Tax=Lunatimonas lonarensis TaxID=1232681 RepID=R7ZSI3_9BACT|nr:DUF1553 domain-containing protein [Lunatimonas lonarensis]EON76974.1 putative protein-signal peptide and transmembrane prediction [Lunatimonas lonarensis]